MLQDFRHFLQVLMLLVTTLQVSHHLAGRLFFGVQVQKPAKQISKPSVSTSILSQNTDSTATCGGNVGYDGGAPVTARGVCWGTSPNPTVNDSHTTNGSGTGYFTSSITGLAPNSVYYVRAYATNSQGTSYGEQRSFTTHPTCSGSPTVTDYDGNVYQTVQIGNQCWMKENLRTTHYADGTTIPLGTSTSTTTSYRYNPNNDANNVPTYGYLYNWTAVMNGAGSSIATPSGVQGVCPTGWHVPSDAEWTQLTDYVGSQSVYLCGNDSAYLTGSYSPMSRTSCSNRLVLIISNSGISFHLPSSGSTTASSPPPTAPAHSRSITARLPC